MVYPKVSIGVDTGQMGLVGLASFSENEGNATVVSKLVAVCEWCELAPSQAEQSVTVKILIEDADWHDWFVGGMAGAGVSMPSH
jgi:hypothetical protein